MRLVPKSFLLSAIVLLYFVVSLTMPSLARGQSPAAEGNGLFKAKCAMCHGADGAGKTPMGEKLNIRDLRSAEVQKQSDGELSQMIAQGKGKMPAFKTLSPDQAQALVAHIRELGKK